MRGCQAKKPGPPLPWALFSQQVPVLVKATRTYNWAATWEISAVELSDPSIVADSRRQAAPSADTAVQHALSGAGLREPSVLHF